MTNSDTGAALAYRQATARGATAVGCVVALFDTILRDYNRALSAIDAGDVQTRVFELNHALTTIGELQGVLDFERGGEAARRFERFYNVTRGLIMNANVRGSRESILELIELYKPIRQAWHHVDQNSPSEEILDAAPASSRAETPAAAPQDNNSSALRGNWSA